MTLQELPRRAYSKARQVLNVISRVRGEHLRDLSGLTRSMAADKFGGRKIVIVFVEELGFIQFLCQSSPS